MKQKQEHRMKRNAPSVIDHKTAAEMIPRYLAGGLSDREMLAFLSHVRSCHTCYEELETAFMVERTVHYLDNDLDDDLEGSYDLPALMEQDISRKMGEVGKRKVMRRFWAVLMIVCAAAFALMLLDFFGVIQITRLF